MKPSSSLTLTKRGDSHILDLATKAVSKRFLGVVKDACSRLPIKMVYSATRHELEILGRIAKAKQPEDIKKIRKDLFAIEEDPNHTINYIRSALNQM